MQAASIYELFDKDLREADMEEIMGPDTVPATMESVYRAWDKAIAAGDVSSLVSLYAADAEIESPLIYEFQTS